ncbi:MAG TPA: TrkA family potassium uptake protein [Acidimicrobiales bacterium]|nr:TrkA family potassium uptake protein [Acidimicrobiales bacterium]
MKVVIAGAGNVGTSIASDLSAHGHHVLLIERDTGLVERLAPTFECSWLAGDACEVSTLQRAQVDETDVVVAATGDDEDNLVVSLLAKQEFAVPRVIARVNHPKNRWMFNETWGIDVSVSTPHLMTALVEEAVSVGTLVQLMQFAEGSARLVEVTLAPGSPAVGSSIAELGMPRDASVVAVVRERRVVVPRGDTVVAEGDEVIALVTEESEERVRAILVGAPSPGSASA